MFYCYSITNKYHKKQYFSVTKFPEEALERALEGLGPISAEDIDKLSYVADLFIVLKVHFSTEDEGAAWDFCNKCISSYYTSTSEGFV